MFFKAVGFTFVLLLVFCSYSNSVDAEDTIASGTVFLDTNNDHVKNDYEKGLPGIRVSNGRDIVKTDSNGQYSLSVTDDTIIFVIKPRGYITPIDENKLPIFYYIHKPNGSPEGLKYPGVPPTGPLPESIDFPLIEQTETDTFKVLVFWGYATQKYARD